METRDQKITRLVRECHEMVGTIRAILGDERTKRERLIGFNERKVK